MLNYLRHHQLVILWLASIAYVLTFFYFTWFKLTHFGYDNLDLAIFNNSLYNLAHGFSLANAIHPPSYWGDHASPLLYLLAPLYTLISTPLTLLWLQVVCLAACVWPLYKIAATKLTRTQTVIVCLLWLANPVMHNMTMFEFSLVPFAIFFLLWTWFWFEQKNLWLWLLFSLLALSCREDIALVVVMYSLIAWLEGRAWIWRWLPLFLSLGWFIAAQKIIQHYVLGGNYKFSIYYLWLQQSSALEIVQHLVSWGNVELVLGILFPLFFLSLFRPKYLLFLLAPLGSMILSYSGGGQLVLKSHYGGLLLWPLFLALIFWLQTGKVPKKLYYYFPHWSFVYGLLLLATVYASLTYGSFLPQLLKTTDYGRAQAYKEAVKMLQPEANVGATYSFLTAVSSRRTVQLLPYAYGGKGQFALTDYQLDPTIEYLAIDWQEMIYAQAHYPSRYPHSVTHQSMRTNWQIISQQFSPIWQQGNIMIMKRQTTTAPLASLQPSTTSDLAMTIIADNDSNLNLTIDGPLPATELYLEATQGDQIWRWPVAYGLYEPEQSTSTLRIQMNINLPDRNKTITTIKLYSWKEGQLELSSLNSLSARWPDQSLLLEQKWPPDTTRTGD